MKSESIRATSSSILSGTLVIMLMVILLSACDTREEESDEPANPKSLKFLYTGTQALIHHEFLLALSLADSAEKYSPHTADADFLRGRVLSEVGRFIEAEQAYRNALAKNPDYRGVWHNMANNEYRRHEYYKAVKYYETALAEQPSPLSWRGLGRTYIELGKNDSARYAFEQAVQLDSLYSPVYFNLALLEEDEGNYDVAIANVRFALSIEPDNIEYIYLLGSYLIKTGKYEEGVSCMERVINEQPWNPGGYYNMGQALVRLGREDEAKHYFEVSEKKRKQQAEIDRLYETLKDNENPHAFMAVGLAMRRAGRYNDAMHAYKAGLFMDEGNIELRNNIAILHLIRKDTSQAIYELQTILEQDSTVVDVWNNIGVLYSMTNQKERARAAWLTALRYDPRNRNARANLFKLYAEQ